MTSNKITIQAIVSVPSKKAWDYYVQPEHITKWNFASDDWQCPTASNELKVGGKFMARMEAKDGKSGFDFEGVYTEMVPGKKFTYILADDRIVHVIFTDLGDKTEVTIIFDPENINTFELQRNGWSAILNNFKSYAENN